MRKFKGAVVLTSLFLTACGGGGGGGGSTSPASTATKSSDVASSVVATSSTATSQSMAASSSSMAGVASVTGFIVVDQFGYLPSAKKIAVIRNPQTGYDATQHFVPSSELSLVNMETNDTVLTAAPSTWSGGTTDASSGDKAWWFDFSSVTTPGSYAIVDKQQNRRSPTFKIDKDVYKPVLKQALRMFFYQRAGFAKQLPYAEAAWVDGASHIGPGQDKNARVYNDKTNAATEHDLSGGWYDAGDYNKYTSWAADYVVTLLHAYLENPSAWTDDANIPESGNGIPDVLDEVKWGVDWLIKMQDATGNGSLLSIVSLDHKSPPSAATGASYYGTASTNASLSGAAAFALASKVFAGMSSPSLNTYAADLKVRAESAWTWSLANPSALFRNNEGSAAGIGAGQQETDDAGRATKKRQAAIYLFAATGKTTYRDFVDANYTAAPLKAWGNAADPFRENENTTLLYYTSLADATPSVATDIKTAFNTALAGTDNWQGVRGDKDPYRAYLPVGHYTWGSNSVKSLKGSMFMDAISFKLANIDAVEATNAGLGYINYLHGVNPQGMVYLSNMYALGVHSSVNEFYHTWFADGSAKWDRVGTSEFGPAPGFLVGGPNPSYDWDDNCKSSNPNSGCGSAAPNPPKGQPAQKSYKDFNTSWPLNSWSVTENSCGYQSNYLRLLSKFVGTP